MSTNLPPLPLSVAIVDGSGRMTPQFAKWLSESLVTRVGGSQQLSNTELANETNSLGLQTSSLQSSLNSLSAEVDALGLESALTASGPSGKDLVRAEENPHARIEQLEALVASLASEIDSMKKGTVIL